MLLVGVGLFVGVLGVLIRFAGWTSLIAGYDPDRVEDDAGLARFVGTNALVVAALTVALGALEYTEPTGGANWYWFVYAVVVLGIGVRMVRGSRRYETASGDGSGA